MRATKPEGDGLSPVRSEAAEQDRIDRLKAETERSTERARDIVRQAQYIYETYRSHSIPRGRGAFIAMQEEYVRLIAKALTGEAKI